MMHRFFLKRLKVLSTLLLIPTLILFLFIMFSTGRSQIRDIEDTMQSSTESFCQDLKSTLDVCTSQQEMLTVNSRLLLSMRKILESEETTYTDYVFLNSIKSFLYSISSSHSLIENIYLYLDGYDIYFSSDKAICFLENDADASWYDAYSALPEDADTSLIARTTKGSSSPTEEIITIYKKFSYLDGVMVSNLSLKKLQEVMSSELSFDKSGIFLTDSSQSLLAWEGVASAPDFSGTDLSELAGGAHWKRIDGSLYLTYVVYQPDYQYYVTQLVPFSGVLGSCAQILVWPFVMLLFTLFIIFLYSYHITRDNFRQIESVIDLFDRAEKGIYQAPENSEESQPDNEYSLIMNNVIRLFLNTTFLSSQLAEQKYKKEAAELRTLQLQINPHFMINTLQTLDFEVYKIAHGPSDANTIISNLTDILSYSLADSQTAVSIQDEITHIHKYIDIQKYRFPDSFFYFEEVDDLILTHEFKRLLLQPLVENSINHGIRPSGRQGMIKLKIFRRGDRIHVSVTDNGVGISKENVARLRKELVSDTASGIGLDNVNKRLTLTYGSGSALHISSKEGLCTCISFRIPF